MLSLMPCRRWWTTWWPSSTRVSPPPERVPPDARQSTDKVSGDYSRQFEVVGESNSWDFEVPIPPGQLGYSGQELHGDLQREGSLKARQGLCSDGGIRHRHVRSRHDSRVDYDIITLSNFGSFLYVAILS
jgi:hypothetical protein